jgi:hypothetical protein
MSNLIYSSAISTPEALGAATRIQACIRQLFMISICNASPKWKEVNLFLLTDTMDSANDEHIRSFPIGTEVLSFAASNAESGKRKEA